MRTRDLLSSLDNKAANESSSAVPAAESCSSRQFGEADTAKQRDGTSHPYPSGLQLPNESSLRGQQQQYGLAFAGESRCPPYPVDVSFYAVWTVELNYKIDGGKALITPNWALPLRISNGGPLLHEVDPAGCQVRAYQATGRSSRHKVVEGIDPLLLLLSAVKIEQGYA